MAFDQSGGYYGGTGGDNWATDETSNKASRPQYWANTLQANLTKNLVAFGIASTSLESQLTQGEKLNMPYYSQPTAKEYSPGTEVTYESMGTADDVLSVDQARYLGLELDDIQELQSPYGKKRFRENIVTPLREEVDKITLGHAAPEEVHDDSDGIGSGVSPDGNPSKLMVEDSDGDIIVIDSADLDFSDSDHNPITVDSDNVIQMFSKAKRTLRENDASTDDMFGIANPQMQEVGENTLTGKGYQIADETLRNGKVGRLVGVDIVMSNNFPIVSSDFSADLDSDVLFTMFGQRGALDLVMQAPPKVEIIDTPEGSFSTLFRAMELWGSKVFTKNQDRLVSAMIEVA